MNMVLFLLAGFETTSSALSYCSYLLAQHQNELEKLVEEVDSNFPHDSEVEIYIFFILEAFLFIKIGFRSSLIGIIFKSWDIWICLLKRRSDFTRLEMRKFFFILMNMAADRG